jgi:DNA methylase
MPTQQALYADLAERSFDPELSWAEHELPERVRTKHVHRLHPYLGKFVPQLVETFLRRHFHPGQRILDPFAGSGTTILAAERTGRIARVIELDPRYVDLAVRRWEQATGIVARHAEFGLSFTEIAAQRAIPEPSSGPRCPEVNRCGGI